MKPLLEDPTERSSLQNSLQVGRTTMSPSINMLESTDLMFPTKCETTILECGHLLSPSVRWFEDKHQQKCKNVGSHTWPCEKWVTQQCIERNCKVPGSTTLHCGVLQCLQCTADICSAQQCTTTICVGDGNSMECRLESISDSRCGDQIERICTFHPVMGPERALAPVTVTGKKDLIVHPAGVITLLRDCSYSSSALL